MLNYVFKIAFIIFHLLDFNRSLVGEINLPLLIFSIGQLLYMTRSGKPETLGFKKTKGERYNLVLHHIGMKMKN